MKKGIDYFGRKAMDRVRGHLDLGEKKCIIAGAGDFDADYARGELSVNAGDLCIAADRGLLYLNMLDIIPDLIIGDMDSLNNDELLEELGKGKGIAIKKLPVEKNDTDTLAAIKEGLVRGFRRFELYGMLGGRLDHTIANVQCLNYLCNNNASGVLYGKRLRVEMLCDSRVYYPKDYGDRYNSISVFAYGGDAYGVTEKGLKYSLNDAVLKQDFPIGVSNEFIGQESMIEVKKGRLLICVGDFT